MTDGSSCTYIDGSFISETDRTSTHNIMIMKLIDHSVL